MVPHGEAFCWMLCFLVWLLASALAWEGSAETELLGGVGRAGYLLLVSLLHSL